MQKSLSEKQKQYIRKHYHKDSVTAISKHLGVDHSIIQDYIHLFDPKLSPLKKMVFTILIILVPVFFFAILEIGLQIAQYGGNLNLFAMQRFNFKVFIIYGVEKSFCRGS